MDEQPFSQAGKLRLSQPDLGPHMPSVLVRLAFSSTPERKQDRRRVRRCGELRGWLIHSHFEAEGVDRAVPLPHVLSSSRSHTDGRTAVLAGRKIKIIATRSRAAHAIRACTARIQLNP